jgi:4-amino-4-deoxy-L-arabinose transferase-like glycosyltransferase
MSASSGAAPRTLWPAGLSARFFEYAARSHRHATALLLLVSLIAFLPGFFQIPPVDRDEPRFAQATKQMIATGDYVDIRFQDKVRYKKPIGIYWMQATAVRTLEAIGVRDARTAIAAYRVPSLIGAIGAVLATYWCALVFAGRRGAILAALMMASSLLLCAEARLATADAMLLFTVVAAMGVLARAYLAPHQAGAARLSWTLAAIFWTALAAGILIKGPVIVVVVGLTAVSLSIFDRTARWLVALRPLAGLAWLLLLVLPWFVAIYLRTGNAFLADAMTKDVLAKVLSSEESHGWPPGFYVVLFFAAFYPGSMLAGLAAPGVWAARREPAIRFLLAWLVPSWIFFELIPTKLPHYVLPLYPAIAILIAAAVQSKTLSQWPWLQLGPIGWWALPLVLGIAALATAFASHDEFVPLAWPFLVAAIACGVLAWRAYAVEGAEAALLRAAAASILFVIAICGFVAPTLKPPSFALADVLRHAGCADPHVAAAGYEEPSLVFLTGSETHDNNAFKAADFLERGGCRFAFIDARLEPHFTARAKAIGLHYERWPAVAGFNFSSGRAIIVDVFRASRDPSQ